MFVEVISKGNKYEMLIDIDDFENFKDGVRSFTRHSNGYAVLGQKYVHRVIMNPPKGKVVDHINANRFDNRKENLRIVTTAQNARFSHILREDGVYFQRGKWVSVSRVNGKIFYGGRFTDKQDAIMKTKEIRRKIW